MSIFQEESPEERAFWETLEGAEVLTPPGADPEETPDSPAEEEAPAEEPAVEGEPSEDDAEDETVIEEEQPPEEGEQESAPEPPDALAELQKRLEVAERRISEKDEFINRQANELGDLRNRQNQQERVSQLDGWDDVLDENPARAAELALAAGDQRRYMIAREAWDEISPGAPANYERNITLQRELEQLRAQMDQRTAPIEQRQEIERVAAAYQVVKERYPDFDNFEDAMAQTLETRPLLKESLQSVLRNGSPEDQAAALEDLYLLTAGRKRDTLSEAEKEAASKTAKTTAAQKRAANVVTTSGAPEDTALSIADKIEAEWEEIEGPRRDGWLPV